MSIYRHKKYDSLKNIIDLVGATVLLVVFSPLLIIVATINYILYGAPVIFRQKRLTVDGKEFVMLKFRTMFKDAESAAGAMWATKDDPRITLFGRFMRFTRIDELPQLINVIKGDMSLIGPRPERPEIAEEICKAIPSFRKRLQVKAGITGLAQIQAGYASSIESSKKKAALDILYIKNRSLLLDILIVLKTFSVMLTGSGAR